jgi:hypothetical protein
LIFPAIFQLTCWPLTIQVSKVAIARNPKNSVKCQYVKVHIFWEGHKILRNLHRRFLLCLNLAICLTFEFSRYFFRWPDDRSLYRCQKLWSHATQKTLLNANTLKFIYSEKATKNFEISTIDLSYVVPVKSSVEISQNLGAFLEYMDFTSFDEFSTS